MAAFAFPQNLPKKPAARQYNWITNVYEAEPEQIEIPFPEPEPPEPTSDEVTLLTTESGAQLVISGYGIHVGKKSERLVIKKSRATLGEVAFVRLQEVIVGSRGVSVSSDVIDELCRRGIRIGFLDSTGKPFAMLTSPLLTATVETRRAQFAAAANERGSELCRALVAGKLRNQEKLLRYFARTRQGEAAAALLEAAGSVRKLRKSVLEVAGGNPDQVRAPLLGLEGTGGRLYWDAVAGLVPERLGFRKRMHQGAPDPLNAALNYGYGILTSHVWGAAMNAGLDPFAGLLHTDRSGKPSLALDLVEEFRQPVVDRPLLGWVVKGGKLTLVKGMLDEASRQEVAGRVMLRLTAKEEHRGKSQQVRSIVQGQARMAASALRGYRRYVPFSFQW